MILITVLIYFSFCSPLFFPETFHKGIYTVLFQKQKSPREEAICARGVLFNNYFLLYIKNSAANTAFKNKFPYTGGPEACPVAA